MYAEIIAAIQSAKTAAEIVKAAHSLSNYNELVAAVSDVSAKLMDATAVALASQEKQSEMAARIADLERQLAELRVIQSQAEKYSLHQFETGALAYRFESSDDGVPLHYLCAKCFDSGKHTKHQPKGNRRLYCAECNLTIQTQPDPPVNYRRTGSGFGNNW